MFLSSSILLLCSVSKYLIPWEFYPIFFYTYFPSPLPWVSPQVLDRWMLIRLAGIEGIKYSGQTKVASASLQEDIDLSKARGRKPRSQITWPSRLGMNGIGWTKSDMDTSFEWTTFVHRKRYTNGHRMVGKEDSKLRALYEYLLQFHQIYDQELTLNWPKSLFLNFIRTDHNTT